MNWSIYGSALSGIAFGRLSGQRLSTTPTNDPRNKIMFRKRRLTPDSTVSGSNSDSSRCEWIQCLLCSRPINNSSAKRQRVADGVKESHDRFPPAKSTFGSMNALIRLYQVFVEWIDVTHDLHEPS